MVQRSGQDPQGGDLPVVLDAGPVEVHPGRPVQDLLLQQGTVLGQGVAQVPAVDREVVVELGLHRRVEAVAVVPVPVDQGHQPGERQQRVRAQRQEPAAVRLLQRAQHGLQVQWKAGAFAGTAEERYPERKAQRVG